MKFNAAYFLSGVSIGIILLVSVFILLNHTKPVQAWYQTASPVLITPTPTPSIQIDTDCDADDPCVSVFPTSTPNSSLVSTEAVSPTQEQSIVPSSSQNNNTPSVPSCGDTSPGDVPNFIVVNDSKGLKLEWAIIPGANAVDIRYGYKEGEWLFGALNIPNSGNYVVEGLNPHVSYTFEIAGVNGCAIGNWSKPFDPYWQP